MVLKLAREKGFLETLFNTIQEGVIVTDADGRITYLNAAAGQLLGIDPERAVGEPLSRYLRDLDWQKIWSADKDEWRKVFTHELEVFYPQQRFLEFLYRARGRRAKLGGDGHGDHFARRDGDAPARGDRHRIREALGDHAAGGGRRP